MHAALHDDVPPVVGQVGMQRLQVRHRRMDVAVDAAALDQTHELAFIGRALVGSGLALFSHSAALTPNHHAPPRPNPQWRS